MSIIKSNSALMGLSNSSLNLDIEFLNFIQSTSFSIKKNNILIKNIGSDINLRTQFVSPDVELNVSYIQRNDFYNEFIMNFAFMDTVSAFNNIIKNDKSNKSYNENGLIILSDMQRGDLANYILKNDFSTDFIGILFSDLFLNSYSFSYKNTELPIVNCSFLSSDFVISKLLKSNTGMFFFPNSDGSNRYTVNKNLLEEFNKVNYTKGNTLTYTTKYFNLQSNVASTNSIGPNTSSLLNGLINNLDFSIPSFNRQKNYFINSESQNSVNSRNIILPLKYSFSVSGVSDNFLEGNLNILKTDTLFTYSIDIGEALNYTRSYYRLIFENLIIEDFTYSLDLNGLLNYTISFSGEINSNSGFKIKQTYTAGTTNLISSNGQSLVDKNQVILTAYVKGNGYGSINGVLGYYIGGKITSLDMNGNGTWLSKNYIRGKIVL
jgi:hypothetical protein